ncbi:hypothetical protein SPRG_11818 [Saprolegnia parasitica CBS 223.65]|uniref:Major facilitator superfamily associated domain-containing protein n=1 Tax=Saprolegnia parasitica (strain CBS 223.65) TaxID=695850 RepID=A0A067C8T5_SAPPC|nr:hypothetical protein SPRG_11818 [Saprolegnia parasitica CBS 223.65]KDO22971.1 hypothetical protein SPRG_11818 [Saprolegnia parasitica CBS 223.65]|eukprot:XP_012206262.1 hypothetical protein SPRG_11818 [Saprolegnia parasitica CBS 223.65]
MATTDPHVELHPEGFFVETPEASFKPFSSGDDDPSTALAPGEPIAMKSRPAIVFFVQMFMANLLQILLPPLNTYIYGSYLHGSAAHVAQIASLQAGAWTLRVFFGVLIDIVPVFGYRRKFWLVAGWLLTIGALLSMACRSFGDPYCDPKDHPGCATARNPNGSLYNLDAPNSVPWFRAPIFFQTLGVMIVQATLDGVLIEYAQRDPISTRGIFQGFTYFFQGIGAVWGRLFLQLFLNGRRYGGYYDWSAGPNTPYFVAIFFSLCAFVPATTLFRDTKNHIKSVPAWFGQLWQLLQNRAVYQLLAFRFLTNLFQSPTGPTVVTWVKHLDLGWANVIPRVPYIPTIILTTKKGRAWNWQKALFIATLVGILLTAFPVLFVVWDVCRNDYFYIILFALAIVSTGMNTLIPGWALVEVAGVGHEATIAAIFATIKDLNVPITTRWRTYMAESFPANLALLDDNHTQNQVGYNWLICLGIQVAGLAFIFLIPSHRQPLLAMKQASKGSIIGGALVIAGYIALFVVDWQQSFKDY